ncbi:MAG: DUF1761 domain-containing protein [Candidatus Moraniibacteriota bacterium]|nr:MAG: DUF1761 domain-containing protein [Candidatus Moranbacteria bacterium]
METNYWAILVCAVASMVIGFVWYGPLFGRKWMEINELSADDLAKREAMQKSAGPLYGVQFLLSLLQIYILSNLFQWTGAGDKAVWTSFFLWLGFVMPTVAGLAMWNAKPAKVRWAMFLISSGYQLILFLVYGTILSVWR